VRTLVLQRAPDHIRTDLDWYRFIRDLNRWRYFLVDEGDQGLFDHVARHIWDFIPDPEWANPPGDDLLDEFRTWAEKLFPFSTQSKSSSFIDPGPITMSVELPNSSQKCLERSWGNLHELQLRHRELKPPPSHLPGIQPPDALSSYPPQSSEVAEDSDGFTIPSWGDNEDAYQVENMAQNPETIGTLSGETFIPVDSLSQQMPSVPVNGKLSCRYHQKAPRITGNTGGRRASQGQSLQTAYPTAESPEIPARLDLASLNFLASAAVAIFVISIACMCLIPIPKMLEPLPTILTSKLTIPAVTVFRNSQWIDLSCASYFAVFLTLHSGSYSTGRGFFVFANDLWLDSVQPPRCSVCNLPFENPQVRDNHKERWHTSVESGTDSIIRDTAKWYLHQSERLRTIPVDIPAADVHLVDGHSTVDSEIRDPCSPVVAASFPEQQQHSEAGVGVGAVTVPRCKGCGKVFQKECAKNKHEREVCDRLPGTRRHQCLNEGCPQKSSSIWNLEKHMLTCRYQSVEAAMNRQRRTRKKRAYRQKQCLIPASPTGTDPVSQEYRG